MAFRTHELSFNNAGIKSLDLLELPSTLYCLSLHGNQIRQIENLSHLKFLKQLDLSSNCITKISSLEQCSSLAVLNLSCNSITKVEGLEALRNLVHIDLSYNKISHISGLECFTEKTHRLQYLDLFGNNLTSLKHVVSSLCFCKTLTVIRLQLNNATNPVCFVPGYRSVLVSQMPWINSLDGLDKLGNVVVEDDNNIPGLGEYLELLETSSTSIVQSSASVRQSSNSIQQSSTSVQQLSAPVPQSSDSVPQLSTSVQQPREQSKENKFGIENIVTPKIDFALLKHKQRNKMDSKDILNDEISQEANIVTERLDSIEDKLHTLVDLCVKRENLKEIIVPPSHDIYESDSVNEGTEESFKLNNFLGENDGKKCIKKNKNKSVTFPEKCIIKKKLGNDNKKTKRSINEKRTIKVQEKNLKTHKYVRSPQEDETCLALMQEVNTERERRWKAEQASSKLMENMKKFQERIIEDKKFQDGAVAVTEKLKEVYNREKKSRLDIENLLKKCQEENTALKDQINILQRNESDQKKMIVNLHETITKLEKDKTEQLIDCKSTYQNLQFDAGALKKELELLQFSSEKQKEQVIQLQELLISRECEHKKLLEGMIPANGKEVQELVEKAVIKEHQQDFDSINKYKLRLEEKNREYNALEDEFRMALQLESNRYNELHEAYEQSQNEFHELSVDYKTIKEKEIDSQSLIAELTSVVKEQKLKIAELVQRKQEAIVNYKDQIKSLEIEVTKLRKLAVKVESLQQDKDRMVSHICNQEAVVQGLRSERKCWNEELAQQSSSLVLDCNRLNAQVEAQKNEISILNNKLTDLEDALKIKAKMILDQTDTIKNLKMEMVKVKNESKISIEEYNKERLCIEEELEQEKMLNKNLQEKLERLNEQKKELKEHILSCEKELTQSKNEARGLREKWKERSEIIDQLENKVLKMKNSFDEKEKLIKEENQLLKQNLKVAENKLLQIQNEHEKEKDLIKNDFELRIRQIIAQKDDELQNAKHQVSCVEEEMRDLLLESVNQKKSFENRIKKLSNAFTEVQNGLI
ncbi:leucine-rich repeat and coiled-coil domain-containing protein 1 isoform X1 [Hydra vulgaris]|uniref:leucine-rich repeat and coiled-coil domain-containing protein 1 isoform X1 n=1 Tax=Hydra vulgaris TaxID=6087 RepID=UPI001F5F218B|nr:leucine-rich repeat and coiled-coil domain-containing protein 1 isoform X1 [Hydra vulgaris]XP_047124195.1 leucine-rich repeat and coiled-coil domain-containing protein 1 isoform X1 [Hydra vulgaris]